MRTQAKQFNPKSPYAWAGNIALHSGVNGLNGQSLQRTSPTALASSPSTPTSFGLTFKLKQRAPSKTPKDKSSSSHLSVAPSSPTRSAQEGHTEIDDARTGLRKVNGCSSGDTDCQLRLEDRKAAEDAAAKLLEAAKFELRKVGLPKESTTPGSSGPMPLIKVNGAKSKTKKTTASPSRGGKKGKRQSSKRRDNTALTNGAAEATNTSSKLPPSGIAASKETSSQPPLYMTASKLVCEDETTPKDTSEQVTSPCVASLPPPLPISSPPRSIPSSVPLNQRNRILMQHESNEYYAFRQRLKKTGLLGSNTSTMANSMADISQNELQSSPSVDAEKDAGVELDEDALAKIFKTPPSTDQMPSSSDQHTITLRPLICSTESVEAVEKASELDVEAKMSEPLFESTQCSSTPSIVHQPPIISTPDSPLAPEQISSDTSKVLQESPSKALPNKRILNEAERRNSRNQRPSLLSRMTIKSKPKRRQSMLRKPSIVRRRQSQHRSRPSLSQNHDTSTPTPTTPIDAAITDSTPTTIYSTPASSLQKLLFRLQNENQETKHPVAVSTPQRPRLFTSLFVRRPSQDVANTSRCVSQFSASRNSLLLSVIHNLTHRMIKLQETCEHRHITPVVSASVIDFLEGSSTMEHVSVHFFEPGLDLGSMARLLTDSLFNFTLGVCRSCRAPSFGSCCSPQGHKRF